MIKRRRGSHGKKCNLGWKCDKAAKGVDGAQRMKYDKEEDEDPE
jgi:hypothetical protein